MLTSILHMGTFPLYGVISVMGAALGLGLLTAVSYRLHSDCSGKFAIVLVLMPFLVACMIMVINGNIGTSAAVLGSFGLLRFRSAPATAKEIAYLFFTMVSGLCCGLGFLTLALLATAVPCIVFPLLEIFRFDRMETRQRSLRITIPEDLEYPGLFDDLFAVYAYRCELERVKTTGMGTMFELSYSLALRDPSREKEFTDALR